MPYNKSVDITKSDTVNIEQAGGPRPFCDAIFVGGAGIVVAVGEDNVARNFTCVAGEILPFRAKRVNSTTTTATLMQALYEI